MNNNCKYLKRKMNGKLECKKTGKIINIRYCNKYDCKYICFADVGKSIKKRTYKLAKKEKNRFSVFTDDLQYCYLCKPMQTIAGEKHELFSGSNRQQSMKYGFVIPLCHEHHCLIQNDTKFNQYWHDRCREYWLGNYGTLEEFIKAFGKSYIKNNN